MNQIKPIKNLFVSPDGKSVSGSFRYREADFADFSVTNNVAFYDENECLYGIKNRQTGLIIIPPTYSRIIQVNDDFFEVYISIYSKFELTDFKVKYNWHKHLVVYNSFQELIEIPKDYSYGQDYYKGLSIVSKNDKWGLIDEDFNVFLEVKYDCVFIKDGVYYVIDKYTSCCYYVTSEGTLVQTQKDNDETIEILYYDKGQKYSYINIPFITGLVKVEYKGRFGLSRKSGETICPCVFEELQELNCEILKAKINGKYGLIDKNGICKTDICYDKIEPYGYIIFAWQKIGKKTYIGLFDDNAKIIIPPKYNRIDNIGDMVFTYWDNNKCGIIDIERNIYLSCSYDNAWLNDRIIVAKKDGFYLKIGRNNKFLGSYESMNIEPQNFNLIMHGNSHSADCWTCDDDSIDTEELDYIRENGGDWVDD